MIHRNLIFRTSLQKEKRQKIERISVSKNEHTVYKFSVKNRSITGYLLTNLFTSENLIYMNIKNLLSNLP